MVSEKTIIQIGIDIDTKDPYSNGTIKRRINGLIKEKIVSSYHRTKSKKGFHYFIKLRKACTFEQSIEYRFYVGDDQARIILDILRHWAGSNRNDILFTKKWKGW